MRTGLVLGGGGEVGIAWEIGVLAALESATGWSAAESAVVVGTSAGSVVGAYVSTGRDLAELAERDRRGQGLTTPRPRAAAQPTGPSGPGAAGTSVVPAHLLELLMSRDGSTEQRAKQIGEAVLQHEVELTQDAFVEAVGHVIEATRWPDVDFRTTCVEAETGRTTLWSSRDDLSMPEAVAASCAVPGFFPPISSGGRHYIDGPRVPVVDRLVDELALEAVVFVGLDLPILGNTHEDAALRVLAEQGLRVLSVTGGKQVHEVSVELMDPAARPRAVEIGGDDGRDAAPALDALFA